MFHRSSRLFLRPAFPEDWRKILSWGADLDAARSLSRALRPCRQSDARAFACLTRDGRLPRLLVTIPAKGVIGSVGLVLHEGEVELGYWIAREFRGQGYATEAGRAMLEIARMIGHRRLVAGHFIDNPASGRVLRKLGFRPTGRVRHHYGLGRDERVERILYAMDLDEPALPKGQAA